MLSTGAQHNTLAKFTSVDINYYTRLYFFGALDFFRTGAGKLGRGKLGLGKLGFGKVGRWFCAEAADPSAEFFFKFRLADKKNQLISGLAEYSRNLRNSAGIWLTNDKFG